MQETNALIGGILSVIHNDQFVRGHKTRRTLRNRPGLEDLLRIWPSPFTAVQVINNRACPKHRDPGSSYSSLDIIATVGDFTGGTLSLADLRLELKQRPGTVTAILGHALHHEVNDWEGDRVSFVWFLKDDVAKGIRAVAPRWSYHKFIRPFLRLGLY